MNKLLKKEWIVNRTQILLFITALLLITVVLSSKDEVMSLWLAVLYTCLYPYRQQHNEEQVNSGVLINSLPVRREDIVTANYVSTLLLGAVLIALLIGITQLPMFNGIPLLYILLSVLFIGFYVALFYPIYYLLGPRFAQMGMIIFFVLSVTVLPIFVNLGLKNDFWGWGSTFREASTPLLATLLLALMLLALMISRSISIHLYRKKAF